MDSAQRLVDVPVARRIVLDELAKNWIEVKRLGDGCAARTIEFAGRKIFGKDAWALSLL